MQKRIHKIQKWRPGHLQAIRYCLLYLEIFNNNIKISQKKFGCGGGGGWGLTSPKTANVMHQSVLIFPQSATYFLYAACLRWWWEWGEEEVPIHGNLVDSSTVNLLTEEESGQARPKVGRIACVGSDFIIWTIKNESSEVFIHAPQSS